jgi:hypothetical protein
VGGPKSKIHTIYGAILQHATNGDQLIIHKLDESVSRGGNMDINSSDSNITVDLGPLISKNLSKQTSIIKDMIDFKTPTTRALLTHPVIETFLDIKWRRVKKYFLTNFLLYLSFLLTYSLFLGNIFYRQDDKSTFGSIKLSDLIVEMDRVVFPSEINFDTNTFKDPDKNLDSSKNVSKHNTFDTCGADPSMTCALEVILCLVTILLMIQEVLQLATLGPRRYLSEYENIMEVLILVLTICGLVFQYDMYVLKWLSAWGICLAYLELIFLIGRFLFTFNL